MKLNSFKTVRIPAIVICMLAAGICYSCAGHPDASGNQEIVLNLEQQGDGLLTEDEGAAGTGQTENLVRAGTGQTESRERAGTGQTESRERAGSGQTESRERAGSGQTENQARAGSGHQEPSEETVFVHVCGFVRHPGVYELRSGSRVYEAIEAAGGFEDGGASDYLNLAETVRDGMKLEVPDESQAQEWKAKGLTPASGQAAEEKPSSMVNLNTATKEELMSLRGIGESRAEDIIRYREKYGGFQSIEDIMNVSGIKDAAFEKIKDSITV